jgi:3D (Asp-Asp-Asp) domain-containing protein
MGKYVFILIIMLLSGVIVWQRHMIEQLTEVHGAASAGRGDVELSLAKTEGALAGFEMVSRRDRVQLLELKRLIQVKEHQIESMRRGQILTITAYSPSIAATDGTPFLTASNSPVREGIIAVSRDLQERGWTFGRKVYIDSMGVFTVEDLLHERWTNQLDIFMFSTQRAIQFGKKNLRCFLLGS